MSARAYVLITAVRESSRSTQDTSEKGRRCFRGLRGRTARHGHDDGSR